MRANVNGCLVAMLLTVAGTVSAQGWKPERNVELVIPTSPGGSNDIAGRTIHKLWSELKLLPVASSVVNRSGVMASVPTWEELGYVSSGSWKGVFAPPGITAAQVAFWQEVMQWTAQSEEFARYAEQNLWLVEFKGSADTRKWLDQESAALKTIMGELGLVQSK